MYRFDLALKYPKRIIRIHDGIIVFDGPSCLFYIWLLKKQARIKNLGLLRDSFYYWML